MKYTLKAVGILCLAAVSCFWLCASPLSAGEIATNYFQGWENESWTQGIPDWDDGVTRVASGTNGIIAASGNGYAEAYGANGPWTQNGGYSADWGGGWTERLDIYLDVSKAADTSYWWSLTTAICKKENDSAVHLQDNIFMCAGTGTEGVFAIGGRNTNEGAKDAAWIINYADGENISLESSQWLTFEWNYYQDGDTQMSEYNVYDGSGTLLHTLDGPSHDINDCDGNGNPIGGNRYTWFCDIKDSNGDATLAIDNSSTIYVPEPGTIAMLIFAGLTALAAVWFRRK